MKIKSISFKNFSVECLQQSEPLVIKGLFDNHPLREIDSLELACKHFANCKFRAIRDHIELLKSEGLIIQPAQTILLEDYIKHIHNNPYTDLRIRDFSSPNGFEKYLTPPEFCRKNTAEPIQNTIFFAPKGVASNLHVDNDQNHVFLYQILGKKRALIFKPSSSEKLLPMANLSFWKLNQFTEKEIRNFIDFADGYECILEPGDTLYMPKLIWHHLSYLTDAMSVNFRFGRNKYNEFMSNNIHLDYLSQNLSFELDEHKTLFSSAYKCMLTLQEAVKKIYCGTTEKYEAISALIESWVESNMPHLFHNKIIKSNKEFIKNSKVLFEMLTQVY